MGWGLGGFSCYYSYSALLEETYLNKTENIHSGWSISYCLSAAFKYSTQNIPQFALLQIMLFSINIWMG